MGSLTKIELQDFIDDAIAHFVKNERRMWNSEVDKRDFDRSAFFIQVTRQLRELYGENTPAHIDGKILL